MWKCYKPAIKKWHTAAGKWRQSEKRAAATASRHIYGCGMPQVVVAMLLVVLRVMVLSYCCSCNKPEVIIIATNWLKESAHIHTHIYIFFFGIHVCRHVCALEMLLMSGLVKYRWIGAGICREIYLHAHISLYVCTCMYVYVYAILYVSYALQSSQAELIYLLHLHVRVCVCVCRQADVFIWIRSN